MPRKKTKDEQSSVFSAPGKPSEVPGASVQEKRRITEISGKAGLLVIKWEIPRKAKKKADVGSIRSGEEPVPALPDKLQELKPFVVGMLKVGCPECRDEQVESIRVSGVQIVWKKAMDDLESSAGPRMILGAAILAMKDGKVRLKTPRLMEMSVKGGHTPDPSDEDSFLSPACASIIYELIELAERYLRGERLQPALPGMDGQSAAAGEKEE